MRQIKYKAWDKENNTMVKVHDIRFMANERYPKEIAEIKSKIKARGDWLKANYA